MTPPPGHRRAHPVAVKLSTELRQQVSSEGTSTIRLPRCSRPVAWYPAHRFGILNQTRCAACQSLEAGGEGRMQHLSMPIMPVWAKVPALSDGLPLLWTVGAIRRSSWWQSPSSTICSA